MNISIPWLYKNKASLCRSAIISISGSEIGIIVPSTLRLDSFELPLLLSRIPFDMPSTVASITSMAIDNCYQQEYIKVAIGKGCSSYRVLWHHVMKNAIPSIIDSLPTISAIIIGNLLMVEKLYSFPGLTQSLLTFFSKSERDGVVANIILIGLVYFILDTLFSLLKWAVVKPLKEESI